MGGFQGLPPKVGIVRREERKLSVAEWAKALLEGRRVERVEADDHTIVLFLDSGESFSVHNVGGWRETS